MKSKCTTISEKTVILVEQSSNQRILTQTSITNFRRIVQSFNTNRISNRRWDQVNKQIDNNKSIPCNVADLLNKMYDIKFQNNYLQE